MTLEELQATCRDIHIEALSTGNLKQFNASRDRELAPVFKDWSIGELAVLMQALRARYNPLLDDYVKELGK